ncbi:MAG: dihydrofolate reductase [Hyphomicrobiaceae bacterium]
MSGADQEAVQTGPGGPRNAHGFRVTLVVAASRNGTIGRAGDMPWRMPSSLRQFRRLTLGRPMIMGRKTYQAIGRPLDGRDTIVVTRDKGFSAGGVHVVGSLGRAFDLARALASTRGTDEIIIAGGGEIYLQALPYATDVHLDLIEAELDGDTTFPPLAPSEWQEVAREPIQPRPGDEHSMIAIHFQRLGTPFAFNSA